MRPDQPPGVQRLPHSEEHVSGAAGLVVLHILCHCWSGEGHCFLSGLSKSFVLVAYFLDHNPSMETGQIRVFLRLMSITQDPDLSCGNSL